MEQQSQPGDNNNQVQANKTQAQEQYHQPVQDPIPPWDM